MKIQTAVGNLNIGFADSSNMSVKVEGDKKLYEDALWLSVNKNLEDITTLLTWAREAEEPRTKLRHIKQACDFLNDVVTNLDKLDKEI
jgi:hypothetical protein